MVVRLDIGASTAEAQRARASCADAFPQLPRVMLDDLLVVVSELVTNVVLHTHRRTGALTLSADDRRVVVEVRDHDRRPLPRHPAAGSRGLRIVASLATTWGVRATPRGKVVWAELSVPAR